jgi:hypothetical protein
MQPRGIVLQFSGGGLTQESSLNFYPGVLCAFAVKKVLSFSASSEVNYLCIRERMLY